MSYVLFPGVYGTLDELTETLVLIQTRKVRQFPVIMYGSEYWKGLIDWIKNVVLENKFISPEDFELFTVMDDLDEIVEYITKWYHQKAEEYPEF